MQYIYREYVNDSEMILVAEARFKILPAAAMQSM